MRKKSFMLLESKVMGYKDPIKHIWDSNISRIHVWDKKIPRLRVLNVTHENIFSL